MRCKRQAIKHAYFTYLHLFTYSLVILVLLVHRPGKLARTDTMPLLSLCACSSSCFPSLDSWPREKVQRQDNNQLAAPSLRPLPSLPPFPSLASLRPLFLRPLPVPSPAPLICYAVWAVPSPRPSHLRPWLPPALWRKAQNLPLERIFCVSFRTFNAPGN